MKAQQKPKKLDFDHWLHLAKHDPEGFEDLRSRTIDEAIAQFSKTRQTHLRRLQWRVDRVRERSRTPMAACIAISNMMWDSFHHLNVSYKQLHGQVGRSSGFTPLPSAKVLSFRPRRPLTN